MRNRYTYEVRARCPVNPAETDVYAFTLESAEIIEVEKIVAFFKARAGRRRIYQERLTAECATALGARVTSVGWHSGVRVESEAP